MNIDPYIQRLSTHNIAIFLFHGVIKNQVHAVRNYNRKHLLESEFSQLIQELKNYGNPISMDDLIKIQKNEKLLPPNSFIISFDDGFENNFSIAAPLLDHLKIPAIFYITSGFIDKNLMSWIDQIDYALEETQVGSLDLSFYSHPIHIKTIHEKKEFLINIRNSAKLNKEFFLKKESYIDEIFSSCKVKKIESHDTPLDLKMSWDQVKDLSQNPLFTIGGHTHSHPIMSYLTPDKLQEEIKVCLTYLENAVHIPIKHFSYPEGGKHCYNDSVIKALQKSGITCCPTAIDGINTRSIDLFNLRRITVI